MVFWPIFLTEQLLYARRWRATAFLVCRTFKSLSPLGGFSFWTGRLSSKIGLQNTLMLIYRSTFFEPKPKLSAFDFSRKCISSKKLALAFHNFIMDEKKSSPFAFWKKMPREAKPFPAPQAGRETPPEGWRVYWQPRGVRWPRRC